VVKDFDEFETKLDVMISTQTEKISSGEAILENIQSFIRRFLNSIGNFKLL
jgi:hypothetical protein